MATSPSLPPTPTLQLALGLVAPLLVQAVLEAALFQRHQEERASAGLPPEHGWAARAYGAIATQAVEMEPLLATMAIWVLGGILWDAALLLSVGPQVEAAV